MKHLLLILSISIATLGFASDSIEGVRISDQSITPNTLFMQNDNYSFTGLEGNEQQIVYNRKDNYVEVKYKSTIPVRFIQPDYGYIEIKDIDVIVKTITDAGTQVDKYKRDMYYWRGMYQDLQLEGKDGKR